MKVLCTIFIVLLGISSPLSLMADAIHPCDQQDQQASFHHDNSSSSDSSAIDCDCCGGCVSVCASTASAVSAIGNESLGSVFDNQGRTIAVANRFHSDPDPDSLFRPPNPNS